MNIRYEAKVLVPSGSYTNENLQAQFEVWLLNMFSGYHAFEVDGASKGWGKERMRAYHVSFTSGAVGFSVGTITAKVRALWPQEEAVYIAVTRLECDPIW